MIVKASLNLKKKIINQLFLHNCIKKIKTINLVIKKLMVIKAWFIG